MSDDRITSCGCCGGAAPPPPGWPEISPGLPALAYRIGTHAQFKAAMLAAIAGKPNLAPVTTREDDDPAIALLDGWATVLDILAFYQERIANEGYLRTATERRSVLELARGIGYTLRPGVAASASLSFTLETAEGAPLEATIPKGSKVQSVPGQDEKPQLFETVEELVTRAEWNQMRPQPRKLRWPRFGDTQATLKSAVTNLKQGDALLFVGAEREQDPYVEHWDFRRVVGVEPVYTGATETDYTVVTWDHPLGKSTPPGPVAAQAKVFVLRQRASLFGHNAPDWRSLPARTRKNFPPDKERGVWPGFTVFDIARQGLFGEYFAHPDLAGTRQIRLDPKVDFSGDGTAPETRLLPGTASARWTGWFKIAGRKRHIFKITAPSGYRLWIDGRAVIGDSVGNPKLAALSDMQIEPGFHDLRLECVKLTDKATVRLDGSGGDNGDPQFRPLEIQLDAIYPKIQAGTWVVLSQPLYQELYRVENAVEDAPSRFLLTSKTTRLLLSGENLIRFNTQLRQAMVFAESEELALAEAPIVTPVFGQDLPLDQAVTAMSKGRRLLVAGRRVFARVKESAVAEFVPDKGTPKPVTFEPGQTWQVAAPPVKTEGGRVTWNLVDGIGALGSVVIKEGAFEWVEEETSTLEAAVVESAMTPGAAATGNAAQSIHLAEPLRYSYVRDSVRILGNVALATHGETHNEVLSSGDAGQTFQKFELKQTPLTHTPAAHAGGAESTLEVRINDILWSQAPSLFGLGANDRCYVTRRADDGKTTVQFGDGRTGARPPTGVENIRATYRVGLGLAGVLKADQLRLLLTRPLGIKGVTNPLPSAGGDDAEPRDAARQNAPFTVRTLDRIVSLLDFEDFARTFAGIGKAQADWVWSGSRRVVFLTVAGANGKPLQDNLPPLTNLRDAIQAAREPTQPAQASAGTPLGFKLRAKVLLDDGYIRDTIHTAVRTALLDAFSFERRAFGQGVAKSEVLAVIHGVEGVKAVDLDAMDFRDGPLGVKTFLPARRSRWSAVDGRILPAELLTLEAEGIELKEMPA